MIDWEIIMKTLVFVIVMIVALVKYEFSHRTAMGKTCYAAGLAIMLVPVPGTFLLVWPLIKISGFFKK